MVRTPTFCVRPHCCCKLIQCCNSKATNSQVTIIKVLLLRSAMVRTPVFESTKVKNINQSKVSRLNAMVILDLDWVFVLVRSPLSAVGLSLMMNIILL